MRTRDERDRAAGGTDLAGARIVVACVEAGDLVVLVDLSG